MKDGGVESSALVDRAGQHCAAMRGTIYSLTRVLEPPAGFEAQAPYFLASGAT